MSTSRRLSAIALKLLLSIAPVASAGMAVADVHPSSRSSRSTAPLLFHVHGMAFSADGKILLVPSHTGLAVYRDGGWSEIDGPIHDFAGFSLTERAIYASGHPPPGSALPDPLGLVKSTDLGASWAVLALGGEADFHLLAASYRSNAIYVLSTQPNSAMPGPGLHRSVDEGRTWRRRIALGLTGKPFAVAAHPLDVATLAVATDKGLYLSRDAGESFKRVGGRQAVTSVMFDLDGRAVRFTRAIRREMVAFTLEGRLLGAMLLPSIGLDYVTHIAQSPIDQSVFAIATDRRHVFKTNDAGREWRQIAKEGDIP